MKKCWKQVLLLVMVAVAVICIGRTDAKAATIVEEGSCGENATYALDSDGVLTISGSGEISSCAFTLRDSIKKVVIGEKITGLGYEAFWICWNIESVVLPSTLTNIGDEAFMGCSSLTDIIIPDGVTTIGSSAFVGCKGLANITIPNSVTDIGESAFGG